MTQFSRRMFMGTVAAAAGVSALPAFAQSRPVKIGVLADFSGIYTDLMGPNGVVCVEQAIADIAPGFPVEVVFGDHQNKADIGAGIARRWFDTDGVDMLIAGPNSAVGLAASAIAFEKNKPCLGVAVTATDFTGTQCNPNTINWTYDGYMLSKAVATETVRAGGKKWYFITTDNAFGHSLQAEATAFIEAAGGEVVGHSAYPIGMTDFASFLLAAQSSGADTLGLALGGTDLLACLKQATEFGVTDTMKTAAFVVFLNDLHAAGLDTMRNLLFTNSFYWDLNDTTRAWTDRVLPKLGGSYPGMVHAGCYAVTAHYLKALASLGVDAARADGAAVVAAMKAMPTQDDAFGAGRILANGRAELPAYLLQAKAPEESTAPWDLCKVISTMPAVETVRPVEETGCSIV
ncbi:MAG: ABC transporter substrate-binding protein [Pseudotabrizicola sp.]|uniref:ABC transporter substrate-binding protein n=1 Tax=Pseudotabrizicola sp. TaxID=2939647 RepID=UPI00271DF1FA|nr:ABC transporter substrate-binding protein [Pseudotabrizicola sp.]MDO9638310.1 ABC transporter substrate-binding protein [Pseudotabrizicola sp.]